MGKIDCLPREQNKSIEFVR